MEGTGPAVPAAFVHGVREVGGDQLQLIGIGVVAHQVELEDFTMPAMVGVLEDGQPVNTDGLGHSRTAILGDGAVSWVCALFPSDAQELHRAIVLAAERALRHEADGTQPVSEPRTVQCFLPDEMRWDQIGVTVEREDSGGRSLRLAVVLRLGRDLERVVAAFQGALAQRFASQLVKAATRARKARPAA